MMALDFMVKPGSEEIERSSEDGAIGKEHHHHHHHHSLVNTVWYGQETDFLQLEIML